MMEHVIASQYMRYLNETNQLYDSTGSKASFPVKHSSSWVHLWHVESVQDREQCDTVVIDFSNAFDKVSHDRMLYKLYHIGIDLKFSKWIKSFLSDPSHRVVINSKCSDAVPVTSGVPQQYATVHY